MLSKLEFFRPEEVEMIEVEIVKVFLSEVWARCEGRQVSWKRWEGEERVFRVVSDDAKVFR